MLVFCQDVRDCLLSASLYLGPLGALQTPSTRQDCAAADVSDTDKVWTGSLIARYDDKKVRTDLRTDARTDVCTDVRTGVREDVPIRTSVRTFRTHDRTEGLVDKSLAG